MTTEVRRSQRLRRRVESAVARYMDAHALWPAAGVRLLVAVSGGPDSTALLLVLSRLAERRGVLLAAAYFDHGLRGATAAEAERAAVQALADRTGASLVCGSGDVRGLAKQKRLSLEEAARRARYAFLAGAAREAGCTTVATGHTASDQAETVLMHLLRGAGLTGLAGMSPRSPWPVVAGHTGLNLIRPLLTTTRADTVAYCEASAVQPLEDETNRSTAFLRNRLRLELLPTLRQYNPRVDAALLRLADAASSDATYLETIADAAVRLGALGEVQLARTDVAAWPAALRRHALRAALRTLAGDLDSFSERHILALERLVLNGRTGDALDLPRNVHAGLTRNDLDLRLGTRETFAVSETPVALNVPGEARFGSLIVRVGETAVEAGQSVAVDAAALGTALSIRRRRPGDRFQPLGMIDTKKLQDFFVDAHVPRAERDSVPLFETPRGIVWVGGLRIADWAKPVEGQPVVVLSYTAA